MSSRLPSLNALRAFESAARHRSLTRAAEELHVTPAAISHQVKALEADLGIKLLSREGQDYVLTNAAAASLPRLREGFDCLADAVRLMREDTSANLLTISVSPTFASIWLVPRIDRFKVAYPDYDVRLETTDAMTDFAREGVDMAVRFGAGDYPGHDSIKLFSEEIAPVCSPDLLKRLGPVETPADLLSLPLLHVDWRAGQPDAPSWAMWAKAAGLPDADVRRGLRFSHAATAHQAAIRGQGVALLNAAMAEDAISAGYLTKPFDISLRFRFAYYIVYPEDWRDLPKIAAFRSWLLSESAKADSLPTAEGVQDRT